MLKEQLQSYLNNTEKSSTIENMMSLKNQFSDVYDLSSNQKNENERANYATQKAGAIFQKLFNSNDDELIVLIYEWPEPNAFLAPNKYLHDQFSNIISNEIITTESDKIIVYKAKMKDIAWQNILQAIANTEIGLSPALDQKIYFFNIDKDKAFHMYDDRGCLTKGS